MFFFKFPQNFFISHVTTA